jgi:predicted metal-dependent phosphoesterase TrpH
VDRTAKNVNMLLWHRKLRLIDHGAALYMHHDWDTALERARDPFARIRDHVLLSRASRIVEVDAELTARLTPDFLADLVSNIPAEWLVDAGGGARRADYLRYLTQRLAAPRAFVMEAANVRA